MERPFLSIVTVVYNDKSNIERTIKSVLNVMSHESEYIIIDGASTDGTRQIVERYINKLSYFISEPDSGIYDAMNKATTVSKGEYICFMNSGDTFFPDFSLESLISVIDRSSDIVYGDTNFVYDRSAKVVSSKEPDFLLRGMPFSHQSVFVRTELAKRFQFNLSFKYVADYDFFYRAYINGMKFQRLQSYVISSFDCRDGISLRNPSKVFSEIISIQKERSTIGFRLLLYIRMFRFIILERVKIFAPEFVRKLRNR